MSEPDWNLLNDDPQKFFGLPEKFDKRTLKRAYNKLIRKYKPEQAPEEFQKIRSAYEQLIYWVDEDVPSGNTPSLSININEKGIVPYESIEHETPAQKSPLHEPVVPFSKKIETESPVDLYNEISSHSHKTEDDFVRLAFLSDAVASDGIETKAFQDWLLAGLKDYPGSYELQELFSSWVCNAASRMQDSRKVIRMLQQLSKRFHDHRFYSISFALWLKLLRLENFSVFETTLEQCESTLFDPDEYEKVYFYIKIMKAAVWTATRSWIEEKSAYLETHYELIPHYDLDIYFQDIERLRTFSKEADAFRSNGNTERRKKLYDTIYDFCTLPNNESLPQLTSTLNDILQNRKEFLKEFSQSPNTSGLEHQKKYIEVWEWMLNESGSFSLYPENDAERLIDEIKQLKSAMKSSISKLKKKIKVKWPKVTNEAEAKNIAVCISFILLIASIFISLFSANLMNAQASLIGIPVLISCLSGIMIYGWLVSLADINNQKLHQGKIHHYENQFRNQWIDFLAMQTLSYEEINAQVEAAFVQQENEFVSEFDFVENVRYDFGAYLIATARRVIP